MTALRDDPNSARGPSDLNVLIGAGTAFEGTLRFAGTARIDGTFKGDIQSKDVLVIGEKAIVDGDVNVGSAIVHGTVRGSIRASVLVELRRPCRFTGNLFTPALVIEQGVIFEGITKMENLSAVSGDKAAAGKR